MVSIDTTPVLMHLDRRTALYSSLCDNGLTQYIIYSGHSTFNLFQDNLPMWDFQLG